MPTLILALILGAASALIGVAIWLILLLLRYRGHGRRVARWTAGVYLAGFPLLLFIGLPLILSYLIAHAGTRPDEVTLTTTPADLGVDFLPVSFPSSDGIELRGWLLPGNRGTPPIVFSHGLFRSRHEVLQRSCALNRLGHPVLLFDFRGHGLSRKAPLSLGYLERRDVLGALDFLLSETEQSKAVLAGVSMGAAASIMAAADAPDKVAALVVDSPFSSLDSTVQRHTWEYLKLPRFPFVPLFCWNLARIAGFNPREFDVAGALSRVPEVPTLFIYGRDDPRMPPEVAHHLFEQALSPRNELLFVDKAGHGRAFQQEPETYLRAITSFLNSSKESIVSAQ